MTRVNMFIGNANTAPATMLSRLTQCGRIPQSSRLEMTANISPKWANVAITMKARLCFLDMISIDLEVDNHKNADGRRICHGIREKSPSSRKLGDWIESIRIIFRAY